MFVSKKRTIGMSREFLTASNSSIKQGDALKINAGYVEPAGATDAVFAIADETVTTTGGAHTPINCILVSPTLEFEVESKTQATQAQVGTKVKLQNAGSVDNAQTAGVFTIIEVLPNKKVIGRFY
ncbi:MAG: hypothetical protein DLD55_01765 [candidate division SR1 bacterium]|nr:MAG: hypothetical protein DLD55_01765 [candidate division SR1 bacterium]